MLLPVAHPSTFAGAYPALITFMKPDAREDSGFAVDFDGTARHAEWLVDRGVAGIVIAGSTGQSATITNDEHVELSREIALTIRARAKAAGKATKVIVSAGSNDTASALRMVDRTEKVASPDAWLHVCGYYNNPPQEGLVKHFTMIADRAGKYDKGIILYNVPGRTNSNIEPRTQAELATHPNILAVKEANGDLAHARLVAKLTNRDQFGLISGEDAQVLDFGRMGGVGVISASANVWATEFQILCDLCKAEKWTEAAELQSALKPCVDAVFCAKNPIPLHAMLNTDVRPPLCTVSELREPRRSEVQAQIAAALAIEQFPHCPKRVKAPSELT